MLSLDFSLEPKDAVDFFQKKGMHLAWGWQDTDKATNAKSFTVAKVTSFDLLSTIYKETERAVKEGITFDEFKKSLRPRLEAAGWWGKKEVLDIDTGEIRTVQLGSYRRLRTIFRANVKSAYMAGRCKRYLENAENRPYWQYVAVMDGRTRQDHAQLHGRTWRFDDPIWHVIWPPNGINCRCRVTALSEGDIEKEGITPQKTNPEDFVTREAVINKDGETMEVTGVRLNMNGKEGIFYPQPGWDGNPALLADESLKEAILQKAKTAPEALRKFYLEESRRIGTTGGVISPEEAVDTKAIAAAKVIKDRISKAEGDAGEYVLKNGLKTGNEYIAAYSLNTGKTIFRAEGEPNRAPINLAALEKAEKQGDSVHMTHNHKDSVSLSVIDLVALGLPAVGGVSAKGNNLVSHYLASRGTAYGRNFPERMEDIRDGLKNIIKKYNIPFILQDHIVNLALHEAGLIIYTYTLSDAQAALYRQHPKAREAVSEIRSLLWRK